MSPMNSNAALMTRSLQMRNSLLTAATAAGAAGQPASGGQPSPSTASALLASQAAAAAMFNHQQASAASLFAAANIKSNSAASGVAGVHQISILLSNGQAAASQGQAEVISRGQKFLATTYLNQNLAVPQSGHYSIAAADPQQIDFSLPITSTYLRRMRALGLAAATQQGFTANTVVSQ